MTRYELNHERSGIEIYFDSIPSEEMRAKLRQAGWRWHKVKRCWYTKQSEEAVVFAKEVCGEKSSSQEIKQTTSFVMTEMKKGYCYADSLTNF